jgi:hypothetical protein
MKTKLFSKTHFMNTLVEDSEIKESIHERLLVKILLLLSITLFGFQIKTNEKFEMKKFKLNSVCLYHIDRNTLIKKFGKPQKTEKGLNEFTGEVYYIYKYHKLEFEIYNNKADISSVSGDFWNVSYKGINISIGQNAKILKSLFPNYFKNKDILNGQIDILIKNTDASYIQFLIKNEKIKEISFSENY